jgi:hypothetical protein
MGIAACSLQERRQLSYAHHLIKSKKKQKQAENILFSQNDFPNANLDHHYMDLQQKKNFQHRHLADQTNMRSITCTHTEVGRGGGVCKPTSGDHAIFAFHSFLSLTFLYASIYFSKLLNIIYSW